MKISYKMSEPNKLPENPKKEENEPLKNSEVEYHDEKILSEKKILIVGAGGLGCELLKLLVINGFKQISIIDMDKIERSNLNRQFLFDHSSIGKYKSEIAVEKVKEYRQDPSLNIKPYIGNIKDENKFGDKFYSNFDLVLNALDNNDARYYINSICFKLNIPLINSGSEGIYGMVNWHIRGLTPCFACQRIIKEEDVIPICSIRLRPEKLEHSVAWAKILFEQIFIENNKKEEKIENNENKDKKEKLFDENMPKKTDNFDQIINYAQYMFFISINEYQDLTNINNTKDKTNNNTIDENKEKTEKNSINIDKLYPIDIIKSLNIKNNDNKILITDEIVKNYLDKYSKYKLDVNSIDIIPDKKNISEITKLIEIFITSYYLLSKRSSIYEFDKEDEDIINFVYSASNLRCYNFNLNLESKFKIKEIAGKIIAAIAYTNNIISSIEVLEAKKYFLIKKNPEKYLKSTTFGFGYNISVASSINLVKNKNCPICSDEALKEVENMKCYETEINFEKEKLNNLLEGIKENILKLNEDKNININVEMNKNLIYTEGVGLEEDEMEEFDENKNKKINEFINKDNEKSTNNDNINNSEGNKNDKFMELIVSTWNDKFEENSKKSYSIKIKNNLNNVNNSNGPDNNIKFKELFLNRKRKRDNEAENEKEAY